MPIFMGSVETAEVLVAGAAVVVVPGAAVVAVVAAVVVVVSSPHPTIDRTRSDMTSADRSSTNNLDFDISHPFLIALPEQNSGS
jgi:hypothetical protein